MEREITKAQAHWKLGNGVSIAEKILEIQSKISNEPKAILTEKQK